MTKIYIGEDYIALWVNFKPKNTHLITEIAPRMNCGNGQSPKKARKLEFRTKVYGVWNNKVHSEWFLTHLKSLGPNFMHLALRHLRPSSFRSHGTSRLLDSLWVSWNVDLLSTREELARPPWPSTLQASMQGVTSRRESLSSTCVLRLTSALLFLVLKPEYHDMTWGKNKRTTYLKKKNQLGSLFVFCSGCAGKLDSERINEMRNDKVKVRSQFVLTYNLPNLKESWGDEDDEDDEENCYSYLKSMY